MDRLRDDLLARPRFPRDQNSGLAERNLLHIVHQLLHHSAFCNQLLIVHRRLPLDLCYEFIYPLTEDRANVNNFFYFYAFNGLF